MRAAAGIVLGWPLAAALVALLIVLPMPGGDAGAIAATLLLMPLWVACVIIAAAQPSRWRAWLYMGGATLTAQALLWIIKLSGFSGWST